MSPDETFAPIAAALATQTGDAWRCEEYEAPFTHLNTSGRLLIGGAHPLEARIHAPRSQANPSGTWRLSFSGDFDGDEYKSRPYGTDGPPVISVSADKAPAVIARDILRRLLPGVLEAAARVATYKAQWNDYTAKSAATRAALLALPGWSDWGNHEHPEAMQSSGEPYYVRATPQGDSVRFEAFNVPAALALKIASLLSETSK